MKIYYQKLVYSFRTFRLLQLCSYTVFTWVILPLVTKYWWLITGVCDFCVNSIVKLLLLLSGKEIFSQKCWAYVLVILVINTGWVFSSHSTMLKPRAELLKYIILFVSFFFVCSIAHSLFMQWSQNSMLQMLRIHLKVMVNY